MGIKSSLIKNNSYFYFIFININTNNTVARLGKTCSRDKTYITCTYYGNGSTCACACNRS